MLKDVIAMMEKIVDRPVNIDWLDPSRGDARHTSADATKARSILGYAPEVSLEAGLRQEWEWIQTVYV